MKKLITRFTVISVLVLLAATNGLASEIFLGFDTQTPVQQYSTSGTFLGNFGQNGATGSALDGAGHVWTVAPAFGNNHIVEYDAAQTPINSFTAVVGGQWIEDMAHGPGNTLWVGTYEGNIFNIDATTGAVNSSFAVANSNFTGVGWDGTYLWATGGLFGNDDIFKLSTTGTVLQTIHTGFNDGMGLGYDLTDNSLWLGYLGGSVRHFDLNGNLLSSFVAGTAAHDGLEVGNIGTPTVPEPATFLLLGLGFASMAVLRRRFIN